MVELGKDDAQQTVTNELSCVVETLGIGGATVGNGFLGGAQMRLDRYIMLRVSREISPARFNRKSKLKRWKHLLLIPISASAWNTRNEEEEKEI